MELLARFRLKGVQVDLPVGLGGSGDDGRRLNRLVLLPLLLQHHGFADDLEGQGIGHAAWTDDPKPVKPHPGVLADPELQPGSMSGQLRLLGLRVPLHQFIGGRFLDLLQAQKSDLHVVALEPGGVGPFQVPASDRHLNRRTPFSPHGEDGEGLGLLGRRLSALIRGPRITHEKQHKHSYQWPDLEHGFNSIIDAMLPHATASFRTPESRFRRLFVVD